MAADVIISCVVSRTVGGPLQLEVPGTYAVVGVGPGSRSWRRRAVEGPYMHGRKLLGAVLDTTSAVLLVRVYGTSWSQVTNRAQVMIDAFSQLSYTLTTVIDGVTHEWECEPADISLVGGDTWQKHHLIAGMQEYQVIAPRNPIPIQGGM